MEASAGTVLREWGRLGWIGFGGPPTHIALLRELCVARRRWLGERDFEDAVAACNLLPGPASTQMAIFCAWRVRGPLGAVVGGLAFVVPGLIVILALAAVFLAGSPPAWIRGAGAGGGAAVAAVAVHAGASLMPASFGRVAGAARARWVVYLALGAVGALSYGGGFVIIPLMQGDAVDRYHWMTATQFVGAVALGQVTPGPVIHTVTVVGYAAAGVGGALLAAAVAFAPSFAFVLLGAARFDRLRENAAVRAFLDGAGPAAIGAILGSSIALAGALSEAWQWAVLAGAAVLLLAARRGVVLTLLLAGAAGAVVALAGGPLPR